MIKRDIHTLYTTTIHPQCGLGMGMVHVMGPLPALFFWYWVLFGSFGEQCKKVCWIYLSIARLYTCWQVHANIGVSLIWFEFQRFRYMHCVSCFWHKNLQDIYTCGMSCTELLGTERSCIYDAVVFSYVICSW